MRTNKRLLPLTIALLALGVVLPGSMPQQDDVLLLRIERQQPRAPDVEILNEVRGLQELQSGWLAEASTTAVERLRAAGVSLAVLESVPANRRYFLVFAGAGGAPPDASSAGAALRQLEETVWLAATAGEDLRPRLPAHLAVAPISFSPAALVRPSFDTPGRPRAVPRGVAGAPGKYDGRVAGAVALVSRDRLAATIRALESFQSRYATTSSLASAANYVADQFRATGLQTEFEDFTFTTANYAASNVVATLRGRSSPDDVVVVCAHYDSYSDQRPSLAPGADDNASGTAAVLEAARVMAAIPFDFTVRFVAFSAEEWGLYGSRYHAQAARRRGERIVGVVNLDMIGYADQMPEELEVLANPASEWLANRFAAAAGAYSPLPVRTSVNASVRSSDHAPFWDEGYAAVLGIEDLPLTNPYYHRVTDRFETLNMEFATAVTKAAVATAAELAQPVSALPPPTNVQVRREVLRSLFGRASRNLLTWTPSIGSVASHVYRSTTSHGPYQRVNREAIQGLGPFTSGTGYIDELFQGTEPMYYVVTAVDRLGVESNYSPEVSTR